MYQLIHHMRPIARWAVESQQRSRRNAMLASTSLTQRRSERVEVEEFLASIRGRTATPANTSAVPSHPTMPTIRLSMNEDLDAC